jgi:uroplakin 1
VECCGTDGPADWIEYNSTLREKFGTDYPWPTHCCKRKNNYEVVNVEVCKNGQNTTVFTKVRKHIPIA